MRCPILEIGWMQTKVGDKGASSECLKEVCDWWSPEMDQCDPTGLLPWVSKLEGILAEIRDKMCGEGRFRK